jgi:hypothetical protein
MTRSSPKTLAPGTNHIAEEVERRRVDWVNAYAAKMKGGIFVTQFLRFYNIVPHPTK